MNRITARLHWTDQPYKLHLNDGEEVFAVLDGREGIRSRQGGEECSTMLETRSAFHASVGTEHIAHPLCGPAGSLKRVRLDSRSRVIADA